MFREIARLAIRKTIAALSLVLFTLLYIVGVGITALFVRIFARRLIHSPKNAGTYWAEAEGYSGDMDELKQQS